MGALTRHGVPALLRPFVIFGRVPFFFYGLLETYVIWLLLLLAMAWPCAWYYRKKRERPNLVTRYF